MTTHSIITTRNSFVFITHSTTAMAISMHVKLTYYEGYYPMNELCKV